MGRFREFMQLSECAAEQEIIGLYQSPARYRLQDIAERTGFSPAGVYRVLHKYGVEPHRRCERGDYEQVYSYRDAGLGAKRIAELTGYSSRQVYHILSSRPTQNLIPVLS